MQPERVLIITGPTCTGKTGLGLSILQHLPGEIISADSRQVYQGLDYVTNKLAPNEQSLPVIERGTGYWVWEGERINLYDVINITQSMSVSKFVALADSTLTRILKQKQLPIVVGGTGYYIDALLGFAPYSSVPPNQSLRASLRGKSPAALAQMIKEKDPSAFAKLSPDQRQNQQRLIRMLEVIAAVGSVEAGIEWSPLKAKIEKGWLQIKYVGLKGARKVLYQRSDAWLSELLKSQDFLEEIKYINDAPQVDPTLQRGLIIKEGLSFCKGDIDAKTLFHAVQGRLHRYIRRQMIWFRRQKAIEWVDVTQPKWSEAVISTVEKWYHQG